MNQVSRQMIRCRLRVRQGKAMRPCNNPPVHRKARYLWMKLNAVGGSSITIRLIFKMLASGKEPGFARQRKTFAVPLVNLLRPVTDSVATIHRIDGIVTNLNALLGM